MDTPRWTEVLETVIGREVAALHFACPGEASNFSRTDFTCDVRPLIRLPGAEEDLPTVIGAKVLFPGILTYDLGPGDTGLLVCCDHEFASWWDQRQVAPPTLERRNDWPAAVFIPRLRDRATAAGIALPAGAAYIHSSDLRLGVLATTHPVACGDDTRTAINTWAAALQGLLIAAVPGLDITAINNVLSASLLAALSSKVKVAP